MTPWSRWFVHISAFLDASYNFFLNKAVYTYFTMEIFIPIICAIWAPLTRWSSQLNGSLRAHYHLFYKKVNGHCTRWWIVGVGDWANFFWIIIWNTLLITDSFCYIIIFLLWTWIIDFFLLFLYILFRTFIHKLLYVFFIARVFICIIFYIFWDYCSHCFIAQFIHWYVIRFIFVP